MIRKLFISRTLVVKASQTPLVFLMFRLWPDPIMTSNFHYPRELIEKTSDCWLNTKNLIYANLPSSSPPPAHYYRRIHLHFLIQTAVQYSTLQYSGVQYSSVQCSTVQYSAVQHSELQCSTVQYSSVQCSTVSYVQYSAQFNATQYSVV